MRMNQNEPEGFDALCDRSVQNDAKQASQPHSNSILRMRFFASIRPWPRIRIARIALVLVPGLWLGFLWPLLCVGQQTTGSISGTVRDVSGAVINQVPI